MDGTILNIAALVPALVFAIVFHEVAQRLGLKFAPRLKFLADESFDVAERIERLLNDPRVARDLDSD
jgi:ribosome-binding factor A